ncbi:MAG: phage major capsid protein family [Anaerosolibacter sp.]|jgi:HK97 family phage major capsid protein|uniref:phage major capsid protein n=1 Tax=Anaerosolibacter sp. TaxID=1872527 RepID=UPI00260AD78D|nr:phage major capsid protein [Anaerosolibacter sp.]MDF2546139.1 phage major capsid protein family [Anaerosolibacter sp.]
MNCEQILKDLREKRKAALEGIKTAATQAELDKAELDIRKLDFEIKEAEAQLEEEKRAAESARTDAINNGQRMDPEQRNFNPIAGAHFQQQQQQRSGEEDPYDTMEYRMAFRNYVVNGTPIPANLCEKRADSLTVVADTGAVIPTTIMNRVIEEAQATGMILSRITQTNYQGGVKIPISEIRPTATWINETVVSDEQKMSMEASVEFSYYLLECKVGLSLLSSAVSLPVFENTIVNNIKTAMIKAIEVAVISGEGVASPKGIIKTAIPGERQINLTSDEINTIPGWAKVEAAMPLAYEAEAIYLMAKATWEKYINGAVDANGQRLGFTGIDGKLKRFLNGREVILVDYLPSFDAAADGDVFAALVNLKEYLLNSNLAMTYKKYFDEDKNKWVHKSLLIADGKMADSNGLVLVKKDIV